LQNGKNLIKYRGNMTIKISDGVPVPSENVNPKTRKGRKGDGRQEAILALQVGQSFYLKTTIQSASSLRWWARARYPDRDFAAKSEKDGVRVWRTK
jgi:hypothetical protein